MKTASQEPDDMLQRIEKLEKQNRRFKVAGTFGVILAGALLIMGQAASKNRIIEAQGFVLVDGTGKRRAELSTSFVRLGDVIAGRKSDTAGLVFFDADGEIRAQLSLSDDGPGLQLAHRNSLNAVTLLVAANGTPGLKLNGENGDMEVRASPTSTELSLTSKRPYKTLRLGSSGLSAFSASKNIRLGISDEGPELVLSGAKRNVRLDYSQNDEPNLYFVDVVDGQEKGLLAGIGLGDNSIPFLFVGDKDGNPRAALSTMVDGKPGLYFYDEKGKVVQRYTVGKPQ